MTKRENERVGDSVVCSFFFLFFFLFLFSVWFSIIFINILDKRSLATDAFLPHGQQRRSTKEKLSNDKRSRLSENVNRLSNSTDITMYKYNCRK